MSVRGNNTGNDGPGVQQMQSHQQQQHQQNLQNNNGDCVNTDGLVDTEHSHPPSYRARNNFLQIPAVAGTNNSTNRNDIIDSAIEDTLSNNSNNGTTLLNDSTAGTTVNESSRHSNQQHQQSQNSIISETVTVISNNNSLSTASSNENSNSSSAIDDDMKIRQDWNSESHKYTGVLIPSVLPILVKLSASATRHSVPSSNQALSITSGSSSSSFVTSTPMNGAAIASSQLPKSTTDILDIDRLFLNANNCNNHHSNNTVHDNDGAMNSTQCLVSNLATNSTESTTLKSPMRSTNGNDLVTIVTITGCTTTESSTGGEMDILARL